MTLKMLKSALLAPALLAPALLAPVLLAPAPAWGADDFPNHPVRMIVPLSAGTTTDIVARTIAERLSPRLGQPVTVENRPGAGGVIAAQAALGAPADGYTILMVNSQHVINPSVHEALPYKTLQDFAGVALVAEAPSLVVVTPKLGVHTLKELIALARQRPESINYASSGIGSQTHLAGAYFARRADINIVHVPYKASSEVLADLVTGRVQMSVVPVAFLLGPIRDGKLLALAVTSRSPMHVPVEVPSAGDVGMPGFEYATWFGFVVPQKVPETRIEALSRAIQGAAQEQELKGKLLAQGVVSRTLGPREFDAYMKADMDRLAPIIKTAGITAN